jgi:outer membrane protein OmpA-like peptidoglycan-associated protein
MNSFRGDALSKVASAIGESPGKAEAALGGVLPSLLGGLANKASSPEGAGQLLDVIERNNFDGAQYSEVSQAVSSANGITNIMNVGRPLLDSVFGGRTNSVTDWISSLGGVSRSSASSLLSFALPMVLGLIGRKVSAAGGGVSSLMDLLKGERVSLKDAPAGLAGALGLSEAAGERPFVGRYEQERKQPVVGAYETQPARGSSWWKWVLPLLALVALLAYFLTRRSADDVARTRLSEPVPAPATRALDLGAFVPKSLPGGVTLNIPSNGVESKLLAFIEDPNRQVDNDTWFSFDRLEFETGSAQLRPSSQEQLGNIANILKAYPRVKVKIGGYTDNVGDDASNLKLSADRATNTMNEIVNLGIDRSRLEAEGYGEQFPVADNATEEGRQRNRRIDIRVTQK